MAVLLHYTASLLHLPPSAMLLVGGGVLAFVPGLPVIELNPELILMVFLPPLLADSAWFTALVSFRRNLAGILSLAVGAVLFTTLVVAVVTKALVPALPWTACAALGAIVSPPDAVSARAVLQHVRLPRRLNTLLEGESLLNDATGLVLLRFAVAAVATGAFNFQAAVATFAMVAAGGIAVGGAVAAVWMVLVRRLSDDRSVIAASTILCWVAYVAGERLHVSGVMSTVTAGLICGWYQHRLFRGSTRIRATASWQAMIFLLEAAVFILIGFSLRGIVHRVGGISVIVDSMGVTVLAVVATVTLARFVWIFGSELIVCTLAWVRGGRSKPLGLRAGTVLGWAGMRGVVTLAFALTLPATMPGRDLIVVTAFAVILATVLIQGTTLGLVFRLFSPQEDERSQPPLDLAAAEGRVALAQLAAAERSACTTKEKLMHASLLSSYRHRVTVSAAFQGTDAEREQHVAAHVGVVVAGVAAGRAELLSLHRRGQIDDDTLHSLERNLDFEEYSAVSSSSAASQH